MKFGKVSKLLSAYADDPNGNLLMIKNSNPSLRIPFQEFIIPELDFTKIIPNGLLFVLEIQQESKEFDLKIVHECTRGALGFCSYEERGRRYVVPQRQLYFLWQIDLMINYSYTLAKQPRARKLDLWQEFLIYLGYLVVNNMYDSICFLCEDFNKKASGTYWKNPNHIIQAAVSYTHLTLPTIYSV
eukprot:TRINITY_DN6579_c0_g1_i1.p1 TRINITY_DN6579_c0_g1~~TRINITY_DN6579_c0_g1_i1.p1  ORF type:complete len:186 (-),score=7.17 TRINITY_DN6579_c0_g1_i1:33-590(-)